ncbi:rhomboid protease GluP [Anaerotignum neopropionicum]|uniref:Rhomboid protease GluP n=1 Tax=Anaerotignum neopropionicum TaxID=36847 RepID=A0A136WIC5_9FIRM|nr:rhomboid family intramembrane serine protease [Anaerotignum neopropionicum]KXL54191.1 rhomboid protease GluP [Anaerotignum neopropionicum]KXL54316.1 rhomboid protease GluP [Anaerotignum neopropionicum]
MDNLINFIEKFHEQLLAHSFLQVKDPNGDKIPGVYIRMENPVLYILGVFDKETQQKTTALFTAYTKQMSAVLEEMRCNHLIALGILLAEEDGDEPPLVFTDARIHGVNWRYSLQENKVFAGEGEPNRLFGIERLLSLARAGEAVETPLTPVMKSGKPWACLTIFVVCALLLAVTMFSGNGDAIIQVFGISRGGVLKGEYYRFFTSMFLHSGLLHLASNGIFLYYFGVKAEYIFGNWRFLGLYLISGLCGGICSILFHDVLAIGASGAIYGVLGAMLVLTKKNGPRYTGMNYATMLLLAFTSIGFGFLDMGVDNFAHIGGFLSGILVFLIYRRYDSKK